MEVSSFEAYGGKPTAFVMVDITNNKVDSVARRMLGAAGTRGTDLVILQQWMLRFGVASTGLRQVVGEFGDWVANRGPPWAAYKAVMSERLIGLDKCPVVRPVGVGETWRQILEKCVLAVTGAEAKKACGTEQLCKGLVTGIEGAIHVMRLLWQQNSQEEYWRFLRIDACNAFNE